MQWVKLQFQEKSIFDQSLPGDQITFMYIVEILENNLLETFNMYF